MLLPLAGCGSIPTPWRSSSKQTEQEAKRAELQAHLDELKAELAEAERQRAQAGAEGQQAEPEAAKTAGETPEETRARLEARLAEIKAELAQRQAAERQQAEAEAVKSVTARAGAGDVYAGREHAGAVADEPQAALIARLILNTGGTAADAAAALDLALAVTRPDAAGLGGGGICLVRLPSGRVDSLDFLARAPKGGGAIAIPGNLAGMTALQARYGRMRWSDVVIPAERLAGAGKVTRSVADALAKLPDSAMSDVGLARLKRRSDGRPRVEGDALSQTDLAATLAQIRTGGTNVFYHGPLGRAFVQGAAAKGGAVAPSDLADYTATLSPADAFEFGNLRVSIPNLAIGAGQLAAETLSAARGAQDRAAIDAALQKSLDSLGAPPRAASDYGSTSFLVVDRAGMAVSCALTMNGPFGAQATVPRTGIVMAKNPATAPEGYGGAFLDPMIAQNKQTGALHIVASAAGAPSGLANVIEAVLTPGTNVSARDLLASVTRPGNTTTNLYLCRAQNNRRNAHCSLAADPNASGLAASIIGK